MNVGFFLKKNSDRYLAHNTLNLTVVEKKLFWIVDKAIPEDARIEENFFFQLLGPTSFANTELLHFLQSFQCTIAVMLSSFPLILSTPVIIIIIIHE